MKSVIIFRTDILRGSETFIQGQAQALQRFQPYFVGWRRVDGLRVPPESSWVANRGGLVGRLSELKFRVGGPNQNLLAHLQNLRPKIVHAHFGPDACQAMCLASRLGLPLVSTFHGYDVTSNDLISWRHPGFCVRQLLTPPSKLRAKGSLFIAVSAFIRERLLKLGFPPERVIVHYIGVDTQEFQPLQGVERKPLLLFVGRLVEKKGCSYLLKAASVVQRQVPNLEVVIIGEGPERKALELEAAGHLKNCRFLGSLPPPEVKEWMQRASIFCVPSITARNGDSEGFGIVFIEAQACGTPVVSFSSGGVPEAVAHGESGFLAPEGDWEALARFIVALLQDKNRWTEFSQAGRLRTAKLFDLRKQTSILEDLYENLEKPAAMSVGSRMSDPSLLCPIQ